MREGVALRRIENLTKRINLGLGFLIQLKESDKKVETFYSGSKTRTRVLQKKNIKPKSDPIRSKLGWENRCTRAKSTPLVLLEYIFFVYPFTELRAKLSLDSKNQSRPDLTYPLLHALVGSHNYKFGQKSGPLIYGSNDVVYKWAWAWLGCHQYLIILYVCF